MAATAVEDLTARATLDFIRGRTIAVIGYGAQGRPHALNLRDSGLRVTVAQRPGGPRYEQALADGFAPVEIAAAVRQADILIYALPDEAAPGTHHAEIEPHLRPGQTLAFLHGFNIHYSQIAPPAFLDVILLGPKGQGRAVRNEFVAGRGVAALVAVHQDASGRALETALGWAAGIGAHHTLILKTTFAHETETDLFGEQAVICGGVTSLMKAGFETLVDAGYPPELAYLECCHELKLIIDLIYERGITQTRERISNTARFGDLTRGPRVVGPEARAAMRQILEEIRDGRFAREWLEENRAGRRNFVELTQRDRVHPVEAVGTRLRAQMGIGEPGGS